MSPVRAGHHGCSPAGQQERAQWKGRDGDCDWNLLLERELHVLLTLRIYAETECVAGIHSELCRGGPALEGMPEPKAFLEVTPQQITWGHHSCCEPYSTRFLPLTHVQQAHHGTRSSGQAEPGTISCTEKHSAPVQPARRTRSGRQARKSKDARRKTRSLYQCHRSEGP